MNRTIAKSAALMEWAYASHSAGPFRIVSSRSGFIAAALGNLLTVYKVVPESVREISPTKRFDHSITVVAMSSVYRGSGKNHPDLFVGTSSGKGYFVDISNMSIIAIFDPPAKNTFEGLILTRSVTSAVWSPAYPGSLFIGLSNGQLFSLSLVKSHDEQEYPYFTSIEWTIENEFCIDFLEFDVHTENTLIAASRNGATSMISDLYTSNPVQTQRWKHDSGIIQCQFYHRIPKCIMLVSNSQVDFILTDEERHISMFSPSSKRPILGIWVPRVVEDVILVMTLSRIFVFRFEDGSWRRKTEVPYFEGHYASHASLGSDKVAVATDSGNLIVYELRNDKVYIRNIHRGISKPTSGSSNGTLVALGKGNMCYVLRDMEMVYAFQISQLCEIDQVEWISEDVIAIAAHETQRNKLFTVSVKTRRMHSILKQRHELLIGDRLHIHVHPDHCFAVVVGGSLLMFYSAEEVPREISNNLFNQVFHMSFRNDNLVNVVTTNKCVVCKIDPYSQIMHIPIYKVKGKITSATTFPDKWIVIGTNNGEIYSLSLDKEEVIGKLKGAIQRFIISHNMEYMIAIDVHSNFAVFDRQLRMITGKQKIRMGFCMDSEHCVFNFTGSKSLSLYKLSDISQVGVSTNIDIPTAEEAKELFKERVGNAVNVTQVLKLAEELCIFPICDVLSPFSNAFDPKCYGMNLSVERFKQHALSLLEFLRDANNDREMRLMPLVGKKENAISILLTTTSKEHPTKNSIKAAIACANVYSDAQLKQTVDSLVSGGCASDAIDILILKSKYFDALKLLVADKNIEMSVAILQTVLHEFDIEECVSQILICMTEMGNKYQALAFLTSCEAYTEAADCLLSMDDSFTASVVKSIETNGAFNPEKFKEILSS